MSHSNQASLYPRDYPNTLTMSGAMILRSRSDATQPLNLAQMIAVLIPIHIGLVMNPY
jgi:hypothetical protein